MTLPAITALRSDHTALGATASTFSAADWATPSGCAGWAVRDVIAHMTQLFRLLVDPSSLPAPDPAGTERTQDRYVDALRHVEPTQLLADYRTTGEQAIVVLEGMQGSEQLADLGDLGRHPLHLIANAYAFDHYTHLRVDLLGPLGPLEQDAPPADEEHLTPAIDWMVAGIPQMCAAALDWLPAPVTLELTGPGARSVHFGPHGDGTVVARDEAVDETVATVSSSTTDLVLWGTRRRRWQELDLRFGGDDEVAARFCDAIHVF